MGSFCVRSSTAAAWLIIGPVGCAAGALGAAGAAGAAAGAGVAAFFGEVVSLVGIQTPFRINGYTKIVPHNKSPTCSKWGGRSSYALVITIMIKINIARYKAKSESSYMTASLKDRGWIIEGILRESRFSGEVALLMLLAHIREKHNFCGSHHVDDASNNNTSCYAEPDVGICKEWVSPEG